MRCGVGLSARGAVSSSTNTTDARPGPADPMVSAASCSTRRISRWLVCLVTGGDGSFVHGLGAHVRSGWCEPGRDRCGFRNWSEGDASTESVAGVIGTSSRARTAGAPASTTGGAGSVLVVSWRSDSVIGETVSSGALDSPVEALSIAFSARLTAAATSSGIAASGSGKRIDLKSARSRTTVVGRWWERARSCSRDPAVQRAATGASTTSGPITGGASADAVPRRPRVRSSGGDSADSGCRRRRIGVDTASGSAATMASSAVPSGQTTWNSPSGCAAESSSEGDAAESSSVNPTSTAAAGAGSGVGSAPEGSGSAHSISSVGGPCSCGSSSTTERSTCATALIGRSLRAVSEVTNEPAVDSRMDGGGMR